METCADCGKPIYQFDATYRRANPAGRGPGTVFHSSCGDPFGTKKLTRERDALRLALTKIADADANEENIRWAINVACTVLTQTKNAR
jgi:hypothetical protein